MFLFFFPCQSIVPSSVSLSVSVPQHFCWSALFELLRSWRLDAAKAPAWLKCWLRGYGGLTLEALPGLSALFAHFSGHTIIRSLGSVRRIYWSTTPPRAFLFKLALPRFTPHHRPPLHPSTLFSRCMMIVHDCCSYSFWWIIVCFPFCPFSHWRIYGMRDDTSFQKLDTLWWLFINAICPGVCPCVSVVDSEEWLLLWDLLWTEPLKTPVGGTRWRGLSVHTTLSICQHVVRSTNKYKYLLVKNKSVYFQFQGCQFEDFCSIQKDLSAFILT